MRHERPGIRCALGSALVLLVAVCLVATTGGCADTTIEDAYAEYTGRIEPLLDSEQEVKSRMMSLLAERSVGDPADPRFFAFLRADASPFYAEMMNQVEALAPVPESMSAVHSRVRGYVQARLDFVTLQLRDQELIERGTKQEDGVLAMRDAGDVGDDLNVQYRRLLGEEPVDSRFTQLAQIKDSFQRKFFIPMTAGAKDASEVEAELRRRVLPKIQELRGTRFEDDPASRALREVLAAWHEFHRLVADNCQIYQEMLFSASKAQQALESAEDHFKGLQDALHDVRLKM